MMLCRTIHSEFWKMVTSRSMMLVVAAAVVCPVLLAGASGFAANSPVKVAVRNQGFETAGFGQPFIILLASLNVYAEWSSGQIRTSLAATPDRKRLLAGKTIVSAMTASAIGLVATPMAVCLEQWARARSAGQCFTLIFTPEMLGNVLSVGLNYLLIALIAQSLTVITRSIVATIVVLVPMVLGFTIGLVPVFPILRFLPDLAGIQLLTGYPGLPLLSPLPGALVMAVWAIGMLAISVVLFNKRDIGG
ncbi:ABC transporter permease [Bifidobacterium sp. ESL0704]|uniref:ABC transporter permease n=1 Tax=Bifidobacterium sp. ESL0704 TaxID=2983219 RepID=UPI0023FA3199|nr:ABC transporter permease [Bifidobacterium sp. ESL0704]WEV52594.1 ABC transporter permease [Bifidobacterium sp. ESL0704]